MVRPPASIQRCGRPHTCTWLTATSAQPSTPPADPRGPASPDSWLQAGAAQQEQRRRAAGVPEAVRPGGGGGARARRQRAAPGSGWFSASVERTGVTARAPASASAPPRAAGTAPPPEQRHPSSRPPGWQDVAGLRGGEEGQPAAERQPLLARVLLVSAPARAVTPRRGSARARRCRPLRGWGTPGQGAGALAAGFSCCGGGSPTPAAWSATAPRRAGRVGPGGGGSVAPCLCCSRPRQPPGPGKRSRTEVAQWENGWTSPLATSSRIPPNRAGVLSSEQKPHPFLPKQAAYEQAPLCNFSQSLISAQDPIVSLPLSIFLM